MKQGVLVFAAALLIASCTSDDGARSDGEPPRRSANPQAAELLVAAQQALDDGALNAALMLTDSLMRVEPELADLYFLRARIFTGMQRLDLAEGAYRRVLEQDAAYQGAWMNLGNLAFRQGAYRSALERYQKELAAYPSPKIWVAIGSTYEEQRQPDSARYAYEQAISLDDEYASAYLHLGQLYKARGALKEAAAVSRKGVQLDPDNPDYQYALGSLLVLMGESEEAIGYLSAVLEARPWHYWATYNLGQAYARLGRRDEAQLYLDRAEQLQDDLEAIEYWQSLARGNPDQLMLWVKLAQALRRAGRESEAREADRLALSLAPRYMIHEMSDAALALEHRRAGLALANGDAAGSVERYRALLDRNADRPDIWLNLGVVYAASGQVDDAKKAWETALRYAPKHAGARTLLFQLEQPYVPGGHSDEANRKGD